MVVSATGTPVAVNFVGSKRVRAIAVSAEDKASEYTRYITSVKAMPAVLCISKADCGMCRLYVCNWLKSSPRYPPPLPPSRRSPRPARHDAMQVMQPVLVNSPGPKSRICASDSPPLPPAVDLCSRLVSATPILTSPSPSTTTPPIPLPDPCHPAPGSYPIIRSPPVSCLPARHGKVQQYDRPPRRH